MAVLALGLFVELLLNRIGTRMLQSDFVLASPFATAVDGAGLFAFHFVSVLGVLLATLGMAYALRPFPSPDGALPGLSRGLTTVAMVGFAVICVLGIFFRLPPRVVIYLVGVFAFLVGRLGALSWNALAGRGRVRLWLLLMFAAATLHLVWIGVAQLEVEANARYARTALALGEAIAVTLAAISPACFLPRDVRWRAPALFGALVAVGAFLVADRDPSLAARVAEYGFGLQLPELRAWLLLYAVALGAVGMTVLALLRSDGALRLRGYGLLLVALSGYQLELPYQLAATWVGLLCLVHSYLRAPGDKGAAATAASGATVEKWSDTARRLAARVGAAELIVVGEPGAEEMRVQALVAGVPVALTVSCRSGVPGAAEISVGKAPPSDDPVLSLARLPAARGPRPRQGLKVETGDTTFDALFRIDDARVLHGPDLLLSDALRPRLAAAVDGWLGIWPGVAARWRSSSSERIGLLLSDGESGEHALRELVDLLVTVSRQAS